MLCHLTSLSSIVEFQRQVLNQLSIINAKLSEQSDSLQVLLNSTASTSSKSNSFKSFLDEELSDLLPLKSDESLEQLESLLDDKQNINILVSFQH